MQELLKQLMERTDIPVDKLGEVYDLIESEDLEGAEKLIKELLGK